MFVSLRSVAVCAIAAAMLALPAQAYTYKGWHIMATPSYMAKLKRTGHTPPATDTINYYGGSVFTTPKVVSVMWGSNVDPTTVSTVPGFSAALVNSTYVDQMAQYDTNLTGINGHQGTNQNIGRGTYFGQVVIKPHNTSLSLSDKDVQKELKYQIKKHNLPKRTLNTLYMVYFPANVSINLDGLQSCVDFGAYHFAVKDTKLSKKNLFYAVEPDCQAGIGFITFAASHEFAEATTDNVPTPGSFPDFPQAWNDDQGFEIADLCGNSGNLSDGTNTYEVTQYFLNTIHGCSNGNYTSP